MGYLICAHITKQRPDDAVLRTILPASIGFSIYYNETANIYGIDLFALFKPPAYPFTKAIPVTDLSLDLGDHLRMLTDAYELVRAGGSANGIKRAYINLAELLSAGLDQAVLSICADDDEVDFACIAVMGRIASLSAACGDRTLKFSQELGPKFRLADGPCLHANASELFERFTGAAAGTVGLGSWDPPVDYGFRLVGT